MCMIRLNDASRVDLEYRASPPSDHLANGEDTISLQGIEGDSLPVAGLEDRSPP